MTATILQSDCIDFAQRQPDDSLDFVFGSPPYLKQRTYNINVGRECQEWVEWMIRVTEAFLRPCKGLIAWVVAGAQEKCNYQPGPEGLIWEWYKRGHYQWCPCVWWKVDTNDGGTGIPGSGGKQGLRKDWEYVMMFRRDKELAWADNRACGHEPFYQRVGGEMSNRTEDGQRINANRDPWNKHGRNQTVPNHNKESKIGKTRRQNGKMKEAGRPMPKIANPGNVIRAEEDEFLRQIVKARVGGGHIGDRIAHDGEAPFPEKLVKFFVLSYSPPGGTVCDPFSGTGTTAKITVENGRNFVGCDIRQNQVDLALKRLSGVTPDLFAGNPVADTEGRS